MELNHGKRKFAEDGQGGKSAKTAKLSFGERMLLRQGFVKGMGLGANNQGISEPIAVSLRPAGAGLGAPAHESSQRVEKKDTRLGSGRSGSNTPQTAQKPKKTTIRTSTENGLHIPLSLKTLVDATTSGGTVVSTRELRLRGGDAAPQRQALEGFAEEWNTLCSQESLALNEELRLEQEAFQLEAEIQKAAEINTAAMALSQLSLNISFQEIVSQLHRFQQKFSDSVNADLAVGILTPYLKSLPFDPVENPLGIQEALKSLGPMLRIQDEDRKRTTPYQSMVYTLLLPQLRKAAIGEHGFEAAFATLSEWQAILPTWMYRNLLDQAILNLSMELTRWKPQSNAFPYLWVLPWLEHLPQHHAESLLAQLKEKVGMLLRNCNLYDGPSLSLRTLPKQFESTLMRTLLPRLSALLRIWEIDPSNQDLTILEAVLSWRSPLSAKVMGQLLASELQTKYLSILHLWLTADEVNYAEVGQWVSWFKTLFPDDIRPALTDMFDKGLDLINSALDLGYESKHKLQLPVPDLAAPETPRPNKSNTKEPRSVRKEVEEVTFKDALDAWCGAENLLLIPLREAHSTTGLPLFRITASATGRGGVRVYLKGDVVYAQNKSNLDLWEPIGMEDGLVHRAEGK
ncbi:uncharacterized protein BDR25DRAFT_239654 [Lindgomyces ingoldianus]|uniref:Uncharacterized protein n=1 Tax=Lindgomyces ingoldianus TaxID=673940 RepID=A0ACB6QER3_9PLEO|nr:uncharacterized protein BDR25DRAFT_239654 [Lindgomyces ingoldianus]KAF2465484.1 hypothetical protein BDR25DRAFT_239654 [Lindgomyces ingoldianus]